MLSWGIWVAQCFPLQFLDVYNMRQWKIISEGGWEEAVQMCILWDTSTRLNLSVSPPDSFVSQHRPAITAEVRNYFRLFGSLCIIPCRAGLSWSPSIFQQGAKTHLFTIPLAQGGLLLIYKFCRIFVKNLLSLLYVPPYLCKSGFLQLLLLFNWGLVL